MLRELLFTFTVLYCIITYIIPKDIVHRILLQYFGNYGGGEGVYFAGCGGGGNWEDFAVWEESEGMLGRLFCRV